MNAEKRMSPQELINQQKKVDQLKEMKRYHEKNIANLAHIALVSQSAEQKTRAASTVINLRGQMQLVEQELTRHGVE